MSRPPHGSHHDHLLLHRLLADAGWPVDRVDYRIADGNNAFAAVTIGGKEVRIELAPDRTDCFLITKYNGYPLPATHPLYMMSPPFQAAIVELGDEDDIATATN